MSGAYIVAGARPPIGKMSGALASFSAADLGGFAIKAALERAGGHVVEFEGQMLEGPIVRAAHRVLARAALAKPQDLPKPQVQLIHPLAVHRPRLDRRTPL